MSALLLRLHARPLARRDGVLLLVRRFLRPPTDLEAATVHAFEFKCDERRFARELLERCPQWWIWRCHQQGFCGDFVLVDLSPPDPLARAAIVVELKRGAPIRASGGVQIRHADRAAGELARRGVLGPEPRWSVVRGDALAVLDELRSRRRDRPGTP